MNRRQWNHLANRFEDAICDIVATDHRNVIRGLVSTVKPSKRHDVLVDLGCGIGTFISEHGHQFKEVIGVDYAFSMIARARERCSDISGVSWLNLDMSRAAVAIGSVADMTVCLNVITSPSAMRREAQWRAVAAVTKPGGFALIVVPAIESARLIARVRGRNGRAATRRLGSGFVRRGNALQKYFSNRELTSMLEPLGLAVQAVRRVPYAWSEEELPNRLSHDEGQPWDWACLAVRR
jgi:SAM-dependent methyltransferase